MCPEIVTLAEQSLAVTEERLRDLSDYPREGGWWAYDVIKAEEEVRKWKRILKRLRGRTWISKLAFWKVK